MVYKNVINTDKRTDEISYVMMFADDNNRRVKIESQKVVIAPLDHPPD